MATAVLLLLVPASAAADPGDADPSFGTDGRVVLVGSGAFVPRAVSIDDRDRIVVGGYMCEPDPGSWDATCLTDGSSSFRLARLTRDGGLDPEFGVNGLVTTPIGEGRSEALDVVVRGDGKIVAGGVARSGGHDVFAVVQYLPNGGLDPGFGVGGIALTPVGSGHASINDLAAGPNGTLLAAGQAVDGRGVARMAVARFRPSGALDGSYGTSGLVLGGTAAYGYGLGLAVREDGSAVAAGLAGDSPEASTFRFGEMAVTAAGALDPAFDADGSAEQRLGTSSSFANATVPVPGGGWLAAGAATVADGRQAMAVVRGGPGGAVDPDFGTNGSVLLAIRDGAIANDVLLDRSGRTLLVGQAAQGGGYGFATARLRADGSPDPGYGNGGTAVLRWPDYPIARATAGALQPSGDLVTVGLACVGGTGARCQGGSARLLLARQAADEDRTAPAIRVRRPARHVSRGRLHGLRLRISLSERARLDARLWGRRRGSGRRLVLWRAHPDAAGTRFALRIRPRARALARTRSRLHLRVSAADPSGNVATRTFTITVRR
jgi:uncharacterized delta-60 repeat protein